MFKPINAGFAVLITMVLASNVRAACTYNEAVLAFNSGNLVRGQALMNMAARDGDQRAVRFLASYQRNKDQFANRDAGKPLSDLMLVLNSPNAARTAEQ
ncbi:MAG: hypothetical protein L0Z73_01095 [Gammaproteobacteria bacterium]|nr:hypothetical protein [Gammaproteobacteria bacterium]